MPIRNFNPIIVLFLTKNLKDVLRMYKYHFNPIIVLFLTLLSVPLSKCVVHFNPIIVLFLTPQNTYLFCFIDFNPIIVLFLTGNSENSIF